MSAAEACAAMPSDRVDFIDKDDAGRVLLALFEQVANARCADADEHFDEIRSADREERNIGFAGDRARQKRFSGSRRADEQYAFRNAAAQFLEFLRLLQKVDDFLQLFLGFLDAGDIFKRHLLLMCRQQPRPALSEGQGFVAAALHLAHEEDPETDQEKEGGPRNQRCQPWTLTWFFARDLRPACRGAC